MLMGVCAMQVRCGAFNKHHKVHVKREREQSSLYNTANDVGIAGTGCAVGGPPTGRTVLMMQLIAYL